MSDSVRHHGLQPTRLLHPWDSPGKNTGVGCHFLPQCMKVESESEVAQLCPTLCDPMDCSLPGSSIYGIFQATVLEWGAIAFSRLLPCPGYCKQCCDEHWGTHVSFNSCFLDVYAHQWDCWVNMVYFSCHTTQQSHCWAYTLRKPEVKETHVPQCSSQHCL